MNKDALKTLKRKIGRPQNVITAHLDKLSIFQHLRMHNSGNIISFSITISSLVAVFRSLDYEEDLKSISLFFVESSSFENSTKHDDDFCGDL